MDYVYQTLPTQPIVDAMTWPSTATFEDFVIRGSGDGIFDPLKLAGDPNYYDTAWMMRETDGDKHTEYWALYDGYQAPSSNYATIVLTREDKYANPKDFLTAMIAQAGNAPGWLYVQVTYTVKKV
jgi:hypothetical protein